MKDTQTIIVVVAIMLFGWLLNYSPTKESVCPEPTIREIKTEKTNGYVYWVEKDKYGLLPHCGDGSEKVGTCDFSCAPEGWCIFIPNKTFDANKIKDFVQ